MNLKPLIFSLIASLGGSALAQPTISPLKIEESYTIPAIEVSGLAWRTNPGTKHRELIVVGDSDHKIHVIDWELRKTKFQVKTIDILPLEKSKQNVSSGWESVFSDETGRIFIIQEDPAQIIVIASDFSKIESVIALSPPTDSKDAEAWKNEPNSRGEGLMPLKNGHILVVKEKKPFRLLEFAPKGKKAAGYAKEDSIEFSGGFPLKAENQFQFQPVFSWKFDDTGERLMEDVSGINTDASGKLYLLGDQRNWISLIGDKLSLKNGILQIQKLWLMPSEIVKPEGMVVDRDQRAVVAIDSKKTDKPNLFVLSELK